MSSSDSSFSIEDVSKLMGYCNSRDLVKRTLLLGSLGGGLGGSATRSSGGTTGGGGSTTTGADVAEKVLDVLALKSLY